LTYGPIQEPFRQEAKRIFVTFGTEVRAISMFIMYLGFLQPTKTSAYSFPNQWPAHLAVQKRVAQLPKKRTKQNLLADYRTNI
jgi:hypothetical protein